MGSFSLLNIEDHAAWDQAVALCGAYDTYHLAGYHRADAGNTMATPYLFFFQKDGGYACFPFLKRKISDVPRLETCPYYDATSVYGYPGVVSSIDAHDARAGAFKDSFQKALTSALKQLTIVSFFSRLNPLISTAWLLEGMFDIIALGNTVAIDLTKSEAKQKKDMTKGHLCDIKRAKTNGVSVKEDRDFRYLDDFMTVYDATMLRNSAEDHYFFPKKYYLNLKQQLGPALKLVVAKQDKDIVSAAMFLCTDRIIQYHLSGTPAQYLHLAGAKVILDEVRQWGIKNSYSWLHLGGGVGASQDSLFRFKAGFSKIRPAFNIAFAIIEPEIYQQLVDQSNSGPVESEDSNANKIFFPQYRKSDALSESLYDWVLSKYIDYRKE